MTRGLVKRVYRKVMSLRQSTGIGNLSEGRGRSSDLKGYGGTSGTSNLDGRSV